MSVSTDKYYVSITGLELKGWWHILRFYKYAVPSLRQSEKAEGNVFTEVKKVNGVHHTLTVWKSKRHMSKFLYAGAHRKAIEVFPKMATGKTYGYESEEIPSWDEAVKIYEEKAVEYRLK